MGILRFCVSDRRRLAPSAIDRIVVSGIESSARTTRASWDGDILAVDFAGGESGAVHVPWEVAGEGELTLATASLLGRDRPYQLDLELARGLIGQIRGQLASWHLAGLVVADTIHRSLSEAVAALSRAVTAGTAAKSTRHQVEHAIALALEIAVELGSTYAHQAISLRRQQTQRLPTLLGSDLGDACPAASVMAQLADTFHLAKVSAKWRQIEPREGQSDWSTADAQIEACRRHDLRICVGPLLQSGGASLPEWLFARDADLDGLVARMLQQVESVVTRYRGQVQLWHVASRVNTAGVLPLTPQQRLEMVIHAVQLMGKLDPQTPKIVSFDQIWGEATPEQAEQIEPLQLADAFARADLGLGGFGLELNIGYYPGGTAHRDMLAFSRQLDLWGLLGLPLLITLVVPSSSREDARVVTDGHGEPPRVCFGADRRLPSPASQQAWIARYVPLMLAKNSIQVILWNQFDDRGPHEFPHGGLYDSAGRAKLALTALTEIRADYLT